MSTPGEQRELLQAGDLLTSDEKKLLHDDHSVVPAVDPGLSIFDAQPIDVSIVRDYIIEYSPLAPVSQGRNVEYCIPTTSLHWWDMSRSYLSMKAKILRNDGSELKESDKVGVINGIGWTLFRQCDIFLQQKNIASDVGPLYQYKLILDAYLHMPQDVVRNSMQSGLFFPDTKNHFDSCVVDAAGVNKGLVSRYEYTNKGEFAMEAFLNHDLAQLKGYLPPGLEIIIKLTKADNEVVLMTAAGTERYKLLLTECILKMQGVELSPGALAKQHELLSNHNAYYHFNKSIFRTFTIESGVTSWSMPQLFGNLIPFEFSFVIVPTSHFSGDYGKNPFKFSHLNMEEITFRAEGYQPRILRCDFTNLHLAELYRALYQPDAGQMPAGGLIQMGDLVGGYAVFRIQLGKTSYERLLRIRNGQTLLSLKFGAATTETHMLICYARRHDYFSLDVYRNVFTSDLCL